MEHVEETGASGESGQHPVSGAGALTFRTATREDIPGLVALVESAYRGEASRAGWTTEADLLEGQRTDPEGIAAVVRDPASRMLVARRVARPDVAFGVPGPELVACCQLEHKGGGGDGGGGEGGGAAYFGMFAVRPELQGAGLGRTVLAEAERFARAEWGAREMQMTVIRQRADLIAWYVRRGYTRTGKLSPFPYGDERFGIPQRPDLAFELLVKPLR